MQVPNQYFHIICQNMIMHYHTKFGLEDLCILDSVSCMVCIFVERVKGYCLTIFFSVSGWECLSLDVVSLSVKRCCFLFFSFLYVYIILVLVFF